MTIEEKAREIFVAQEYTECENANDEMWMKRDAFGRGAEWMLEKAKLWLKENTQNYWEDASQHDNCYYDDEELVNDFKKAMEE